ncbi:MAG: M15 family metallopeptidase [Verrucomicrobiae bacterium]|nr:M15 family metallopeptidase [Verrucomicrobiae bacterium]
MKKIRQHSRLATSLLPLALVVVIVSYGLAQERASRASGTLPRGFMYLSERAPDIAVDLRYAGRDNFTGQQVRGYERGRCVVSEAAGSALIAVQADLRRYGFGLKVFDAYRPQRAVNHFVQWTKSGGDFPQIKSRYYPDIAKADLLKEGYIAAKSGHSRGSSVDVTLVLLPGTGSATLTEPRELDMGSPFDFFGRKSHSESRDATPQQRMHRLLLRSIMEKHGFQHLPEEWWHFSLKDEPFPDTYFDFPIR